MARLVWLLRIQPCIEGFGRFQELVLANINQVACADEPQDHVVGETERLRSRRKGSICIDNAGQIQVHRIWDHLLFEDLVWRDEERIEVVLLILDAQGKLLTDVGIEEIPAPPLARL
ncbi:hypothetical protein [Citricoccus sp. K5]|uniref:hypothetical protein n=1 Tax=Citricoccus sp. K5 TaxID=2653135 RepID=UPI00135CA426|nr:hypothetical protein [Citricoccus sp. K5]